jgi:hypothetical protein
MHSRYIDSISYCCMRIRVGKNSHLVPLTAILHLSLCFKVIYGRGDMILVINNNIMLYAGLYALFSFLFLIIFSIGGVLTSKENQQIFHYFTLYCLCYYEVACGSKIA